MGLIFESDTPTQVKKPRLRTKDDWINIGVEYQDRKSRGWTQEQISRDLKIPVSTLQKRLRTYRKEIEKAYEDYQKSPKKPRKTGNKKLDLINQFRSQLRARTKDSNAANNNKSVKWFKQTIKTSLRTKSTSRPTAGKMYTFHYDAKTKESLPYWDKFPLIIYLGSWKTKDGRTVLSGLNLHYIPPKARQEFLEELLPHASTTNINSNTKLKINWSMVKSMRGSDVMIKSYLPTQLKSSMMEIKPTDWAHAIFLPTMQFVSGGKRYSSKKVWSQY